MAIIVAYETLLGLCAPLDHLGGRRAARCQAEPARLQSPVAPAARLFRAASRRRNDVSDRQIYRVREFLTGKLLTTFLDLITLCVLLPFLFYLNATLAWIVLACAVVITLIILAYLKPLREIYTRVVAAETWKSATLGETIVGIKTVKALALEPQRKRVWDERIAEAGKWRLAIRPPGQLAADPGQPRSSA